MSQARSRVQSPAFVCSLRCDGGGGGGGDGGVEGEEGESGVVVAVAATCRSAGGVTAFAAIATNAGSAGNLLFPTDPAFARRQRTRETPPGEMEVAEVEEEVEVEGRRWWWSGRRERSGSGMERGSCNHAIVSYEIT